MTLSLALQPVIIAIDPEPDRVVTDPMRSGFADAISVPASRWVIEPILDPDGERGYIIMPASGDDADGPTLAIWEIGSSFRIDEVRWDTYRTVAQCLTSADVLTEIERRTGVENWAQIH